MQNSHVFGEMQALADADPSANLHHIDLPYRFSSWALNDPGNWTVWRDNLGQLIGWAVLQTPFWFVDYALHADHALDLFPQIINWAESRAKAVQGSRFERPAWFIASFPFQTERMAALHASGWANQSDAAEDAWSKVWMNNPLTLAQEKPQLPPGFSIDCFNPLQEIAAYVDLHRAAFGSENMTYEWRKRVTEQRAYQHDLNLAVRAPDGRPVTFCIGWRDEAGRSGQVEPMGVHPDFQRLGLGRAVLFELLHRMKAVGAEAVFLETDNYRDGAFALYEAAGFSVVNEVFVFRKDFPVTERV